MNTTPPGDSWETPKPPGRRRSGLLAIILVLLAVLIVWGIAIGLILTRDPLPVEQVQRPADPLPAPTGSEALAQADEVWRAFIEASDFAERIALVHDRERVAPLAKDYHERRGHPWPTMNRRSEMHEIRQDNRHVVVFQFDDFSGARQSAALVWDGGKFAVDWESLTACGTMDWPEFLDSQPTEEQTLRLYLGELAPELQPPASFAGGRVFVRMEHRDFQRSAPLAIGPEWAPVIVPLIEGRRVPLTLVLAWNPDLQAFELKRLAARGWNARS